MIDRREYYAKKHRDCPCPAHLELKLQTRRDCCRMRTALKCDYLRRTLDKNQDNPKKRWQTIREFWPSSGKVKSKINKILNFTDDFEIAESLNNHFCTVADKILDNINVDSNINDVLPPQLSPIFLFQGDQSHR